MEYTRPKCEKAEAAKPPISANFAPPPVEQPAPPRPAKRQDSETEPGGDQPEQSSTSPP
jgi:hypothetical protein